MRFVCKLGGTTSAIKWKAKHPEEPAMVISADASHTAPDLEQASLAETNRRYVLEYFCLFLSSTRAILVLPKGLIA